MYTKIFSSLKCSLFALLCTGLGLFSMSFSAQANSYSVDALDSIAGYGSEVSLSNATKNTEMSLILRTPEGNEVVFHESTDSRGKLSVVIPKKNTYEAGKYSFVMVPHGFSFEDAEPHFFEVFADDPSPALSRIQTEDISLSTGKVGTVTVLLQDQYGNKIADHRVQLVSSRSEDDIEPLESHRTDRNGQIRFSLSSQEEGTSRLSAVDETASIALKERKSILFYDNGVASSKGASRFSASMFGAGGDEETSENTLLVSDFRVEFPESVEVNSSDNFLTITALDSQGKRVENFTGTVFIRVPGDENAQVPGDNGKYTFLKRDEGTFTFSQSLTFSESGRQNIEVFLYDLQEEEINVNIFGKKSVEVQEDGQYQGPIVSSDIRIITPENNSKFSSSSVSLTGSSIKNSDVKIFLDSVPYKTISTDEEGEFTLMLHDIEEGKHTVYAQQVEGMKKKSVSVTFSVDSQSPEVTSARFSDSTVFPGDEVSLAVQTAGEAQKVQMRLDNEEVSFAQKGDSDTAWEAEFFAPEALGEYPVLLLVTDDYGNTTRQTLDEKLVVQKKKISGEVLKGSFSKEKNAIILEWKNTLSEVPILYILSTGPDAGALKKAKSISGSATRIEFTDFTEGETLFMAITPVDSTGKEGEISNLIQIDIPEKEKEVVPEPKPEPEPVVEPVVEKDPKFALIADEGVLTVRWESTKNIDSYQILYGMESGKYLAKQKKSSFDNSLILHDLIPDQRYVVRLVAKDTLGNTVFDYGEKSVIIGESTFHAAPSVLSVQPYPEWITQTGPQFLVLIGAIFFLAGGGILGRRKKI